VRPACGAASGLTPPPSFLSLLYNPVSGDSCSGDLTCARAVAWETIAYTAFFYWHGGLNNVGLDDSIHATPPAYATSILGTFPYFSFELVADGVFFPSDPVASVLNGSRLHSGVDLIAGFDRDDGFIFVDENWTADNFAAMASAYFSNSQCALEGVLEKYSPNNYNGYARGAYVDFYTAWSMICPVRSLLQGMAAYGGGNLYMYTYTHPASFSSQGGFALHGSELPLLFGNSYPGLEPLTEYEVTLGAAMRAAWISFAATGNPGAFWPKWDPTNETLLVLDTTLFPDPQTAQFGTQQMPKATCQYMESVPSTPTCAAVPPSPSPPPPPPPSPAAQLLVNTTNGPVLGQPSPTNASIRSFIAIPYAAAPVGSLRWQAPQPPAPWTSPLAVPYASFPDPLSDFIGAWCPQENSWGVPMNFSDPMYGELEAAAFSEDCLNLNVWTPCPDASCALPVIFFIHGGSWFIGSAMTSGYDGTNFAAAGAVFVAINYRLGALGFMASSQQGAGQLNVGFQDQQAALRWVQANIARFGGDPGRVTITGQSTGGDSVFAHLLAPQSAGLFRRALMESCTLPVPLPNPDYVKPLASAQAGAAAFLQLLGCAGNLSCAAALPWTTIVNMQTTLGAGAFGGTAAQATFTLPYPAAWDGNVFGQYPYFTFELVADGVVFPANPVAAILRGSGIHAGIDLMAGFDRDDGASFVDGTWGAPQFAAWMSASFGAGSCAAEGMVAKYDPALYNGVALDAYQAAWTDMYVVCQSRNMLQGVWRNRSATAPAPPVYMYTWAHTPAYVAAEGAGTYPNVRTGPTHGSELVYLFGSGGSIYFTEHEATLAAAMRSAWVSFAASGNPGASWPKWDPTKETLLVLDTTQFPDPHTALFGTQQMPKARCQYMEAVPSTPTCSVYLSSTLQLSGYSVATFGTVQAAAFCSALEVATGAANCTVTSVAAVSGRHLLTSGVVLAYTLLVSPAAAVSVAAVMADPHGALAQPATFTGAGLAAVTACAPSTMPPSSGASLPPAASLPNTAPHSSGARPRAAAGLVAALVAACAVMS